MSTATSINHYCYTSFELNGKKEWIDMMVVEMNEGREEVKDACLNRHLMHLSSCIYFDKKGHSQHTYQIYGTGQKNDPDRVPSLSSSSSSSTTTITTTTAITTTINTNTYCPDMTSSSCHVRNYL